MIIYTPMPLELVLEGLENNNSMPREVEINGVKLMVENIGDNQGRITRLISTNPQDYLNPSFQPGNIVEFRLGY